jgi:GH43 family beta-xylosidase
MTRRKVLQRFTVVLSSACTLLAACSSPAASRAPSRPAANQNPAVSAGATKGPLPSTVAQSLKFSNPIVSQRADPSIYRSSDGYYYLTDSVPAYNLVELRRATTIQGLSSAVPVTVWAAPRTGSDTTWVWAPDIERFNGSWYIYFSAGAATNPFGTHRIYVMHTRAANPLTVAWTFDGKITTNWESFSLDATSFVLGGEHYLVWAQQDPKIRSNSNVYIAKMSSPTRITGTQVRLTQPTLSWERSEIAVNEAPAVIQKNGKVFITYSANATGAAYAMGLLTASASADLLNAASWAKSSTPVFATDPANSVYGPGSNTFTVSEDGRADILVYSARSYPNPTPNALDDPNRSIRAQQISWGKDGSPQFGVPAATGATATAAHSK